MAAADAFGKARALLDKLVQDDGDVLAYQRDLASACLNHGRLQLTLRGFPLYRFRGDRSRGQARGDGNHSFGGTWEVVLPRAPKLPPIPPPV